MSWDQTGFQVIYSLTGNPLLDQLMSFMAEFLVLLIPLTLVYLWFQDREGREDALFTAYSTVTGIIFAYFMGLFFTHENPSATFDTIATFHPENSFPSQHTAAVFAAAFPLIFRDRRKIGFTMFLAAALTGFSRIYIGEHWPLDILGAAAAGAIGLGVAYLSWDKLKLLWSPGIDLYENIEERLKEKLQI